MPLSCRFYYRVVVLVFISSLRQANEDFWRKAFHCASVLMTTNTFMNVNSDISSKEGGCLRVIVPPPPILTRLKLRQVFNFIVMFVHWKLKLCNLRLESGF